MSFLEAFWKGEITPGEGRYKPNQTYAEHYQTIDQCETQLQKDLSAESWKLFQQYVDAQQDISCLSACENFVEGFRMGARMMMEVLLEPQ